MLAAEIVPLVLSDASYRRHIAALRTRLAKKRREASALLASLEIEPWIEPAGGFYLWCRLPGDVDSSDLARAAPADDVVLAPGNVFSASQTAAEWMRFNVAQLADPRLPSRHRRAITSVRAEGNDSNCEK